MLEKGRFTPAADLSLKERESGKEMYERGTLLTTIDAGGTLLLLCPCVGSLQPWSLFRECP